MNEYIGIRMDTELLEDAKLLAKKRHISVSALIRLLLVQEIEKEKDKELAREEKENKAKD